MDNVAIMTKKRGRKSSRPDVEELARLYETRTNKELAEFYNVSEGTVKTWIRYYRTKTAEEA